VLVPRVRDYSPAMLDELLATGEVTWSGAGSISGSDGWIALHAGESAPLTLGGPADIELGDAHRAILDTRAGGGAYFFRQLAHSGVPD
ncbi:Lhr family ATP-dependent helicase, partial [Mycobacterium tuberculosis]|uniref:Lhr family ATP-dependent helicase n=1 Tax=Mycobacterium tuberculosis TaxID=1773 RepID=UPI003F78EF08|nr:ATP-dependent helicase [Mycobacterium tuberculosis]